VGFEMIHIIADSVTLKCSWCEGVRRQQLLVCEGERENGYEGSKADEARCLGGVLCSGAHKGDGLFAGSGLQEMAMGYAVEFGEGGISEDAFLSG